MSDTILYGLNAGRLTVLQRFENAFGGGLYVFERMSTQYLGGFNIVAVLMQPEIGDRLWRLAEDERIPREERVTHASCFDFAMLRRADLADVAACYDAFVARYPPRGICHLPAIARELRELGQESRCEAVCFAQTSVADVWSGYDFTQQPPDHYFLFDRYPSLRRREEA